jgi:hypothetical protein
MNFEIELRMIQWVSNQEPYNKVKAGILGNNFDVAELVGCHMKIGKWGSSNRSVRWTEQDRHGTVPAKDHRFTEPAAGEPALRSTPALWFVLCGARITGGGKRSQRGEELEPYRRTIHRATCYAIDRGALAGVHRSL